MSKIKEALLKEQDNLMEYYFGFYNWLEKYQPNKLSNNEINSIEREQKQKLISSGMTEVNNCKFKGIKKEEM